MYPIRNAIISAAGMGSRLGMNMPKCLLKFNGVSIIEHQLNLLREVPNVRIVVGFMEKDVIDVVRSIRKNVIFVRNPKYQYTSNTFSISLATRGLSEAFLHIDGDLLINKKSFIDFTKKIISNQSLVGITEASTDEAVFVNLNKKDEVINFSRNKKSNFEWSGIAYLSNIKVTNKKPYLYQIISNYLPIKSKKIICSEIDTPDDLARANNLLENYFD